MYSLNYKVTTSTCDSEGRLKLYSALQMKSDGISVRGQHDRFAVNRECS